MLALGQRLHGLAAVEARPIDNHQLALAWRDRVIGSKCHPATLPYRPVVTSIVKPSSRVTTARLTGDWVPTVPLNAFTLPLRTCVLTLLTFTSKSFSTASL